MTSIEYCVQVLGTISTKRYPVFRKGTTRLVKGMSKYEYAARLQIILGFYSLQRRRERGNMIETYKLLNKMENGRMFPQISFSRWPASTSYLRTLVQNLQDKEQ